METNQQSSQMQPYIVDDEIDLRQLLHKLWATRVPVVSALLVISAIYWGSWAFKHYASPPSYTYSRIIQFTFKGIEEETYPNGSPFNLAGVISPGVLSLVYDENNLKEWNVSELKFVQSFNIQPYAPDYNLIIKKYQEELNRKTISTEEIDSLQLRMKEELSQASMGSAIISFMPPAKDFKVPNNLIDKVLLDVPRIWAIKAIESDGVADIDLKIYSSKMFDEERFETLDYMIAFDLIKDNIMLIKENIKVLVEQPNGRIVADEESGYRLPDLEKALNDIVAYDITQIETPIQDLGIAKNTEIVELYYQYSIRELGRELEFIEAQANVVQQTLSNYTANDVPQTAGAETALQRSAPYGAAVPQLSEDFLERLIGLTEQSSDLQYRQGLSDKVLELRQSAAEVNYKIQRAKAVLLSMTTDSKAEDTLRQYYVDLVTTRLPEILLKLQSYTEITNRIYTKLSKENLGYTGLLYKNSGGGVTVVKGRLLTRKELQEFVVLFILAGIGTVIFTMVYQVLRENKNSSSAGSSRKPK